MAGILDYVQYSLGWLLYSVRGHDAKHITNSAAFKDVPEPNMTLEAPEYGISGSPLLSQHTCMAEHGQSTMPSLCWTSPSSGKGEVKEQVLLCEDPDPPIPGMMIDHGIYYGIPPDVRKAEHDDISNVNGYVTGAGWKYVPTLRGTSWIPPGAPLGHGPHRYVFTVIALNEKLALDGEGVNKQKLKDAMVGKVIGWGQWVGVFERPWPQ